jgi:hypothetical protein
LRTRPGFVVSSGGVRSHREDLVGATAVQIVWSYRRGSRKIEHIGSAHDDAELEALKAAARQRLAAGQMELDLGLGGPGPSEAAGLSFILGMRIPDAPYQADKWRREQ